VGECAEAEVAFQEKLSPRCDLSALYST